MYVAIGSAYQAIVLTSMHHISHMAYFQMLLFHLLESTVKIRIDLDQLESPSTVSA